MHAVPLGRYCPKELMKIIITQIGCSEDILHIFLESSRDYSKLKTITEKKMKWAAVNRSEGYDPGRPNLAAPYHLLKKQEACFKKRAPGNLELRDHVRTPS
jgi:hypothetical protein